MITADSRGSCREKLWIFILFCCFLVLYKMLGIGTVLVRVVTMYRYAYNSVYNII
jgi:hypothetical protein